MGRQYRNRQAKGRGGNRQRDAAAEQQRKDEARKIRDGLNARAEQIAKGLYPLGKVSGNYLKIGDIKGRAGSQMAIHIAGDKCGLWMDYSDDNPETGRGDMLKLLTLAKFHGDWKAAFAYARDILGMNTVGKASKVEALPVPDPVVRDARVADADADKIKSARQLFFAAQADLAHTPVDHYLAGRAIHLLQMAYQPRALRFHPNVWHPETRLEHPCLLAAINNFDGEIVGVHRHYLETIGQNVWIKLRGVTDNKLSYGKVWHNCIRLWRGITPDGKRRGAFADMTADEQVYICEGVEDGLSIAMLKPSVRVLVAINLPNIGSPIRLPGAARRLMIVADRDIKEKPQQQLQNAIEKYQGEGRYVQKIYAPAPFKDFNDYLQSVDRVTGEVA